MPELSGFTLCLKTQATLLQISDFEIPEGAESTVNEERY